MKKKNVRTELQVIKMIKLAYDNSKLSVVLSCMITVIIGLIPVIKVTVVAALINSVIAFVSGEGGPIHKVLFYFVLLIILEVINYVLPSILQFMRSIMEINVRKKFRMSLIHTIFNMKYHYFEKDEEQNVFYRVLDNCEGQITNQYFNLMHVSMILIEIVGLTGLILINVWWAAIVIIVLAIPLFKLSILSGQANYQKRKDMSQEERLCKYYSDLNVGRDYVDERSIYQYSDDISAKYHNAFETIRKQKSRVELNWFFKMKASGIFVLIFSSSVASILIFPVVNHQLTVGLYISLINSISSLAQVMSWQLTSGIDQLAHDLGYMDDLAHINEINEETTNETQNIKEIPPFKSLEFRNVHFAYPGTDVPVLEDMSFTIENGKHYSFVGANGSGKTTITKLIAGLYDEYTGEIYYNDIPYRKLTFQQKTQISSIVFQDFAKYPVTFEENIYFGKNYEQKEFDKISELTGIDQTLQKLSGGIKTNLSKISKHGIDLSGGEWQRIALARCIANDSFIRIMDEPTAAMDPLAENQLYEQFGAISRNSTTIFISHRLGSTKLADVIYVISDGTITEKGSHKKLMKKRGLYHAMFETQKGWYKN